MTGLLVLMSVALALLVALMTAVLAWEMAHPPRRTLAWALARGLPVDPGELNLAFEEWWFDRPDGARLVVWEADGGRSSSAADQPAPLTAVFVHGWGHSRVDSLQRIGLFVPLVDRLVLYDLRGHGESTGTSRLGHREDDDLLALLERLGPGRFVLVGHSMGAVVALNAAIRHGVGTDGREIAGVIAYAAYCDFHRTLRGRLRVRGLPARPITDLALLLNRAMGVRPTCVDPAALRALAAPILLIHGVEDEVSPVDDSRRLHDAVPGATIVDIECAAHSDAHEVDQARHDEAVRAFMAILEAGPPH